MRLKLFLLPLILLAMCLSIQASELDSLNLYGFANLQAKLYEDEDNKILWSRLGLKGYQNNLFFRFEYDAASNNLKTSYLQAGLQDFGPMSDIKVSFGRLLSPPAALYPGPADLQMSRWPVSLDPYLININGASVGFGLPLGLEMETTCFTKNGKSELAGYLSGVAPDGMTWSLFYETGAATSVIIGFKDRIPWFLNPSIGLSWVPYPDGSSGAGLKAHFSNYLPLSESLRLYTQYDLDRAGGDDDYLVGLTWQYAVNSFVKVYYDDKTEQASLQASYYFNYTI
ncbi:MAG: hypothetical protein COU22_01480 [Candidatus Komeilibacteria bacterium CG10_big_fil_rev_8_21_14_0_10_41_13]|uniref:Porin domain-containing protein n=1 Tax=Candidatus Komeilibacteria bacterium CG10_big_fil_rev_8_21_14_0_10_41_13 TaxID=1974476 RepID=A0A2M6WCN5_9BACT|nr:MAG: hypothetical protein COU22_01480 [Candidatus Komeilibacteria bacterium CG10_big_fil_rev_8_21_14_0_10_41_13]